MNTDDPTRRPAPFLSRPGADRSRRVVIIPGRQLVTEDEMDRGIEQLLNRTTQADPAT